MDMTTPTLPESLGQPQPTSVGVERVLDESKREAVELSATADQVIETASVDERAVFALFDAMSNSTQDFRDRLRELRIGDRDTCRGYLLRWACEKYGLTLRAGQRGDVLDGSSYAATAVAAAVQSGALKAFNGDDILGMMTIQQSCADKAAAQVSAAEKAVYRAMVMLFDPEPKSASARAKKDEVDALLKRIAKLETESLERLKIGVEKIERDRASSK